MTATVERIAGRTTPATEDELLIGLTDALSLAGWRWTHSRRSDQAVMMGDPGVPDIIAVHPHRPVILAWELKGPRGQATGDQVAWLAALAPHPSVDARIVWPEDYDVALRVVLGVDEPARGLEHAHTRACSAGIPGGRMLCGEP